MPTIEFAGTICAGKLRLMTFLKSELEVYKNFSVRTVAQDLVAQVEATSVDGYFDRHLRTVGNTTSLLINYHSLPNTIILVHRGLYDACAFLKAYGYVGLIEKKEMDSQITSWLMQAQRYTDLVVFVKTPWETAFQRATKKFNYMFDRTKPDIVFTKDFYQKALDKAYCYFEKMLIKQEVAHLIVDGTKSEKENSKLIIEKTKPYLITHKKTPLNSFKGGLI